MEFTILKEDLVHELQTVTGVVEKRATLPILANLLLETGPSGLEVGASDLEVTIRGTARADVKQSGGVTLPAGKLYEIARSLPDAEVKFKSTDRAQVAITCGRVRYKIAGQPRDEFPKLPEVDTSKGMKLPAVVLREMVERVSFAITTEDPRYSLRGALVQFQGGELTLVATDGYRLAFARRKVEAGKAPDLRLVVPRKALSEVAKLAAGAEDGATVVFGKGGDHIYFVVGGHVLTTTVPEGQFPKYEEVMPKACDTAVILPTQELADAVRRVSLLASERFGKAVKFTLSAGKLELSSETEMGEAQESLSVEYAGEEKVIGFNARYLAEFLTVVGSSSVRMELDPRKAGEEEGASRKAGDKPGQFRPEPPAEIDYRYIVMPRDI
jgi:DNA polymerase-3 subunit beta